MTILSKLRPLVPARAATTVSAEPVVLKTISSI
jgi:hypothetical protein